MYYPKQKQPGYKESARAIRSSIVTSDKRPKALISSKAKKVKLFIIHFHLNGIQ